MDVLLPYLNAAQILVSILLTVLVLLQIRGSGFGTGYSSDSPLPRPPHPARLERTLFQMTIGVGVVFVLLSIARSWSPSSPASRRQPHTPPGARGSIPPCPLAVVCVISLACGVAGPEQAATSAPPSSPTPVLEERPAPGGELREAVVGQPLSLNPLLHPNDPITRDASRLVFAGFGRGSMRRGRSPVSLHRTGLLALMGTATSFTSGRACTGTTGSR